MKQYSSKKSIQILGHLMTEFEIDHVVVSPGSRNAPMAIHFNELENLHCYSIIDERSAAFVALGMAKSLKKPVAISCTSGSAVVNYYPAIVEAFYSNIPLLVLTADRPSEYTDIFDGQTIRQKNVFEQHSYGSFQLLEDEKGNSIQNNFKTIEKAIKTCIEKQGPVHINIPLNEPLYQMVEKIDFNEKIVFQQKKIKPRITQNLIKDWNSAKKIMILTGTLDKNEKLNQQLSLLAENQSAVILTEVNSNQYNENFFNHIDRYVFNFDESEMENYAPDLLITIGQNVVSKKIKQFLRNSTPKKHWHIDPHWQPNTYFCLTDKIEMNPEIFFETLLSHIDIKPKEYYNLWNHLKTQMDGKHVEYMGQISFSDFKNFETILKYTPQNYDVHLSNSSTIRYAQLFNYSENHLIYCNRGTSGIDGSTSTAMGYASVNENPTLLITGDIAFFYDINGLWNQYIPKDTRIILINNGEGNIFRIIPGPSETKALETLISTKATRNAENIAKHFQFNYFKAKNQEELQKQLSLFFSESDKPQILEIFSEHVDNAEILKDYFKFLKTR